MLRMGIPPLWRVGFHPDRTKGKPKEETMDPRARNEECTLYRAAGMVL